MVYKDNKNANISVNVIYTFNLYLRIFNPEKANSIDNGNSHSVVHWVK